MPEIRTTPLPPDIEYYLDGAAEFGEMTSGPNTACRLYGETKRLMAIIDDETLVPRERRRAWRTDKSYRVELYGWEIIAQLPPARQAILAVDSKASLAYRANDLAEFAASARFNDATTGGALLPWFPHSRRMGLTRSHEPTPALGRRLKSPAAIRRYVKGTAHADDIENLRRLYKTLIAKAPAAALLNFPDYEAEHAALDADMAGQRERQRERALAAAQRLLDEVDIRSTPPDRRRRRVLRRGAVIAAALIGAANVSAFARGEPVTFSADGLDVSVKARGSLAAVGHGSVDIDLMNGSTRLAGLCVYQDLPAIDQLVSIGLHIQSGELNAVLSAGNLYGITAAGTEHPAIAARAKQTTVTVPSSSATWVPPMPARGAIDFGLLRQVEQRYKAETFPIYREAVRLAVFGRFAKLMPEALSPLERTA